MNISIKMWAMLFAGIVFLGISAEAQVKKTQRPAKSIPTPTPVAVPAPSPTPEKQKKNGRPSDANSGMGKVEASKTDAGQGYTPTYFYEFNRPGFLTSRVLIEHDAAGKGKISFLKKDFGELMSDPIQLSTVTVKGINEGLERMDFLDSTEDYQYEKDLSHLGVTVFRFRRDGRERTVKFNWTTNKEAKFLMDEYRRISNEYVWKFDMVVTRENQPLESPRMLDGLGSYLERGEISDPPHLLPYLKELGEDERLPLIARNHALRLIKQIEKKKK